jgi:hypothetical protein
MDSEQGALPGDHVPGITDAGETHVFATGDRDALSVALQKRLSANEKRAKAFDTEFPPLVIHPWTAYTREATKESMEQGGWSLWGKMLGFGLRAALLLLFPEEALVEGIGHAATAVFEGAAEFALEQGQEAVQEASKELHQEAAEERHEDRFYEQEEAVSKLISESLGTVLQLVAEGRQYEHWLRDAPLSELGLFRIPPLIPDLAESKSRVQARVAEAMAAIVHDAASVGVTRVPGHPHEASSLNTIIVDLHVDAPGQFMSTLAGKAGFLGAKAFRGPITGQKVSDLPDLPIDANVRADRKALMAKLAASPAVKELPEPPMAVGIRETDSGWADITTPRHHEWTIEEIFDAYPGSSPATVQRYTDGMVVTEGGGLAEHLYLYELTNPGDDLGALFASYLDGVYMPTSEERTPSTAAHELTEFLGLPVMQAADLLLLEFVEPLVVG